MRLPGTHGWKGRGNESLPLGFSRVSGQRAGTEIDSSCHPSRPSFLRLISSDATTARSNTFIFLFLPFSILCCCPTNLGCSVAGREIRPCSLSATSCVEEKIPPPHRGTPASVVIAFTIAILRIRIVVFVFVRVSSITLSPSWLLLRGSILHQTYLICRCCFI